MVAAQNIDPPSNLTTVYVTMTFNNLGKLDGPEQQFFADFYFNYFWCDPRLKTKIQKKQNFDTKTDWYPVLEWVNARPSVTQVTKDPYGVTGTFPFNMKDDDPNKNCTTWGLAATRYIGSFLAKLALESFPFDTQIVPFYLESSQYDNNTLMFSYVVDEADFLDNAIPPTLEVLEWDLQRDEIDAYFENNYYKGLGSFYHRFTVNLPMKRQPAFFLIKMVAISCLIVIMSIALHVFQPEVPQRMVICLSTFMALISVVFVSARDIPRLSTLTRLDKFMTFCFFLTFAMNISYSLLFLEYKHNLWAFFFGPWSKRMLDTVHKGLRLNIITDAVKGLVSSGDEKTPKEEKPTTWGEWWSSIPIIRRRDFFMAVAYSITFLIGTVVIMKTDT